MEFQPYLNPNKTPNFDDSDFDKNLCKRLTEAIPEIKLCEGESETDKVLQYLNEDDKSDKFKLVVHEAYIFLKSEKITHYISAIYLGAAEYSISKTKETAISLGGGIDIDLRSLVGVGGGGNFSNIKTTKESNQQKFGKIGIVKRGVGENVVKYKTMPVSKLSHHEMLCKVLKEAVKSYLERASK